MTSDEYADLLTALVGAYEDLLDAIVVGDKLATAQAALAHGRLLREFIGASPDE